jgi:hypothetical protein
VATGEKLLDEQIDIVTTAAPDTPPVGSVANAFDYQGTFTVRAFVISEKAVKESVESATEKTMQGMTFRPVATDVTYSDSSADFAARAVRIKAHALVTMESAIDTEKLRAMLLGKNEDGIKQALGSFPEVKNIQVLFHPEWFVRTIPNAPGRVTLTVLSGETLP